MKDTATIERELRKLLPATESARVALVVQRLANEGRRTPASLTLDPEVGVVGDRWSQGATPDPDHQVTLMRWDVASLLSPFPAVFGDNLFASIDTGAGNLPPGTVLRVGGARCIVTPKAHTGCAKFAARAGRDALAITVAAEWRASQLRGVHLRVLDGGRVGIGEEILVLSRP